MTHRIAEAFHVSRPTLYRHLTAHHWGRDCAPIVHRDTNKLDGGNRRLGETGASEQFQLDTDRKWWPIARHIKAIVYVSGGHVARIRSVDSDPSKWRQDDREYCGVPVSAPLTDLQIANNSPWVFEMIPAPPTRQAPRPARARLDRRCRCRSRFDWVTEEPRERRCAAARAGPGCRAAELLPPEHDLTHQGRPGRRRCLPPRASPHPGIETVDRTSTKATTTTGLSPAHPSTYPQ
ncbi:hypothetical protein ACQPZ8_20255 [Actinomadura nitritigenes]|uniref:hypothetical protein n=1 Tax=Actinomadura nitritigenes TaxID=134602 RepID=UPI003D9359A2